DGRLGSTREFRTADEAADHGLARSLFGIDGIESLFLQDNFVTVTMTGEADWHGIHEQAKRAIADYEGLDGDAGSDGPVPVIRDGAVEEAGEHAPLLDQIGALIMQRVMPALNADGGGLQILGIDENKVVTIQYQGACGSCPSSIQGTLMAIENLLRHEVDPELRVVPAGMPPMGAHPMGLY
ncbi:MAG: NifU family protein, partial [Planctomycetota bacterium]